MSSLRKTLVWTLVLIVATAALAGRYAHQLWTNADLVVRRQLERGLAERVPDWDVQFGGLAVDWRGGLVTLTDVVLRPRGESADLIAAPEIVIALDRTLLAEHQRVVLTHVVVNSPVVRVSRGADGRWNWQELAPPPHSDAACPEVAINEGTVIVHSERTDLMPETEFHCRNVKARLFPSGHRRYLIEAASDVDHAGSVDVRGMLDLKSGAWNLAGDVASVDTNGGVLDVAAGLSPELREQMERLADEGRPSLPPVERAVSGTSRPPIRPVESRHAAGAPPRRPAEAESAGSEFKLPELGLEAVLGLQFEIGRPDREAPLDYAVAATIYDGRIVNRALPAALHDLRGKARVTRDEVVIEGLSAANGDSRLEVSGRLVRAGDAWSSDLSIAALQLELDRRVRDYLHHASWREMYDTLSPAGRFNLDVHVVHDGGGKWDVTLNEFTAQRCSLLHRDLQLPVTDIFGAVRQEGETFHIELDGRARGQPVSVRGYARRPGPEMEVSLRLRADNFRIDRQFASALQMQKLQQVRRAIEAIHLDGVADVDAQFHRPAGPGQKLALQLHADVRSATLDYERFRYAISNLSGTIDYDPRQGNVWRFRNLRGEHGGAVLTGFAEFDLRQPPGRLDLTVSAVQAALDQDLYAACCSASESLQTAWELVNPSGLVDVIDAHLEWVPGRTPVVTLPTVNIFGGSVLLRPLPYRWDQMAGTLGWRDGRVTIQKLLASHGDTYLEIVGTGYPDAAILEVAPRENVAWHVHLDDVRIRRLVCDAELKQALPEGIARALDALDPRGPLDIDLGIDLKGSSQRTDLVTARWGLLARLRGNDLYAGVELGDVHGRIEVSDGVWDGMALSADGFVFLDSATALDLPLKSVHGPFTVSDGQITVGAPPEEWLAAPVLYSETNPYAGRQMQVDDLYADDDHQGRFGLDGVVYLVDGAPEETQYRFGMKLQDASLRRWARAQGLPAKQLWGSVNGELRLEGHGPSSRNIRGDGWVQISPAALYELPVFAQVFPLLNFKTPDKTAFKYAYGDYRLRNGLFDFSRIYLVGDAGRLVGQGTAEFAEELPGRLRFDLYSKADDQFLGGLSRIPILRTAVNNWVHIRVGGTYDNPQVMQQPGGNLGEIASDLMQDLETLTLPINPFGPAGARAPR